MLNKRAFFGAFLIFWGFKFLSMDMNAGYIRAARIHLPNAVEKIAFDRFHVAKQPGEVVDKTRQNEPPRVSWRVFYL
ncbi:transposase (plasmid) [Shigella sonnei]|nr:transposase [Shigella sonnei]